MLETALHLELVGKRRLTFNNQEHERHRTEPMAHIGVHPYLDPRRATWWNACFDPSRLFDTSETALQAPSRRWASIAHLSVLCAAAAVVTIAPSSTDAAAFDQLGAIELRKTPSEQGRLESLPALSRHSPGTWQRVRSAGANGTAATTALLRTADFDRSDPRLAGLMLRCSGNSIEPVLVIVEPLQLRAQPKITLHAAGQESYFIGNVILTGTGLRLPADGMKLAAGPWKGADELGVEIADGDTRIDGVVPLSGLSAAVASLVSDCAQE